MCHQFSVVVVPKFDFEKFLKSIDRYKITHLLWVFTNLHVNLSDQDSNLLRIVPPMVVLLCKVSSRIAISALLI